MRFCVVIVLAFGLGCASKPPGMVTTQVVTFPEGAVVEYNGIQLGRAPANVLLPQDADGRLTERVTVTALPNTGQERLFVQSLVMDPAEQADRIPDRVLIDLTLRGTNVPPAVTETTHVESASKSGRRAGVPYGDRVKPTQAVGLDRWNPGRY